MAATAPTSTRSDAPFLPRRTLGRIVLPLATVFFIVMIWIPILETFYLSLFRKEPGEFYFIGLTNFARLFNDALYVKSLQVTVRFALMEVPIAVALSLLVALLLNQVKKTGIRGVFTASFFFAYVVPLVAVALVWRFMFLPGRVGFLNTLVGGFGIDPIRWLNSEEWALRSLVMVRV